MIYIIGAHQVMMDKYVQVHGGLPWNEVELVHGDDHHDNEDSEGGESDALPSPSYRVALKDLL
jgi:hypothetical protein